MIEIFNKIISTINPMSIMVLGSFCYSFFLRKREIVFTILIVSTITELLLLFFILKNINPVYVYNLYFFIHNFLWLLLIARVTNSRQRVILLSFMSFAVINFVFIEKQNYNFFTFIFGALLYILIFIHQSYIELKKENLHFFSTNKYLLLFTPVLFFFGMSFVFGFRNSTIRNIIIFGDTDLYSFIGNFVNIIYYILIIIYIYKEKKLRNDI